MDSYGVAMGTVSSALGKLQAVGLTRASVGVGTFAKDPDRLGHSSAVLDVMAAAAMCRDLAAISFGTDAEQPTMPVGGSPNWDDPHADPEKVSPPRRVDVSALAALDRHVLRWMSEAFLIASARAILRDGARRPERQPGIALMGGAIPDDEDVAFRIWPERRNSAIPFAGTRDASDEDGYSNEPPF